MNAEALIGMVLGTCTLQELIGQGGMGAVFLAQQSRPRRQVAVKVLLPMSPLAPNQHAAFLERFRRETDAAASLVHPNITPVHEYGERDGLAYLVMPYISGGTLRDELEHEGSMPLAKVLNYLEQMAAALTVAHDCGVIHRDVKPANILKTPEGRLVLSDFGLVKIVGESQGPQVRLTGIGVPMGTPDYMAPEQVLGGAEVDARADIYSLGCILYHMVTGVTPFRGDMPMQVAMQHLQSPPPSPRALRPDLPPAAEQVMLRALAKQATDRYMRALDFAGAFRTALTAAGVRLNDTASTIDNLADNQLFTPRGLFDPMWQKNRAASNEANNNFNNGQGLAANGNVMPISPPVQPAAYMESPAARAGEGTARHDIVAQTSMTLPSFSGILPPLDAAPAPSMARFDTPPSGGPHFGQKMSLLHTMDGFAPSPAGLAGDAITTPTREAAANGMAELDATLLKQRPAAPNTFGAWKRANSDPGGMGTSLPANNGAQAAFLPTANNGMEATALADAGAAFSGNAPALQSDTGKTNVLQNLEQNANIPDNTPKTTTGSLAQRTPTGALTNGQGQTAALMIPVTDEKTGQTTTMMKLTQSFKVIKVPVAGQPGQYMTGLLPMLPSSDAPPSSQPLPTQEEEIEDNSLQGRIKRNMKVIVLISAAVLLIFATSMFWIVGARSRDTGMLDVNGLASSDLTATAQVQATAQAQDANIILEDSLNANNHNWPVSNGALMYQFEGGAYHIANNDGGGQRAASALLPDETFKGPFVYSLTMYEVKGDDTSSNNQFGLIFHYNQSKNGQSSFYFFGVTNTNDGNGEYFLNKYDGSFGADVTPWTTLWHQNFGKEYHLGHGPAHKNTFKIAVNGKNFVLYVNGKRLGSAKDSSFSSGQIGMMVNLKGTEVAFSNLMLTAK
jgi:eukaryotic-like serine/threonine-protein kinase